jgi:hypothetical protein
MFKPEGTPGADGKRLEAPTHACEFAEFPKSIAIGTRGYVESRGHVPNVELSTTADFIFEHVDRLATPLTRLASDCRCPLDRH